MGCILKCSPSINHILTFLIEEDKIFKANHALWKINLNLIHIRFISLFLLFQQTFFFFFSFISGLHSSMPVSTCYLPYFYLGIFRRIFLVGTANFSCKQITARLHIAMSNIKRGYLNALCFNLVYRLHIMYLL